MMLLRRQQQVTTVHRCKSTWGVYKPAIVCTPGCKDNVTQLHMAYSEKPFDSICELMKIVSLLGES